MCDAIFIDTPLDLQELCSSADAKEISRLFDALTPEESGGATFWIRGINDPTDQEMELQSALHSLCIKKGSLCSPSLRQKCSRYSYQDLKNPIVRNFCACYLPQEEYNNISSGERRVARECTEPCSGYDTIKYFERAYDPEPLTCPQATCVIDDVTISVKGGKAGNISLSQVCPLCPLGGCRCIISDVDILASSVDDLSITQMCKDTICYERDENGVQTKIQDCSSLLSSSGREYNNKIISRNVIVVIILVIISILVSLL